MIKKFENYGNDNIKEQSIKVLRVINDITDEEMAALPNDAFHSQFPFDKHLIKVDFNFRSQKIEDFEVSDLPYEDLDMLEIVNDYALPFQSFGYPHNTIITSDKLDYIRDNFDGKFEVITLNMILQEQSSLSI